MEVGEAMKEYEKSAVWALRTAQMLVDLRMDELSELERLFYLRATAHNIPMLEIARIIGWERQGVVDLNSFFTVENKQPHRLTREDHCRWAFRHLWSALQFKPKAMWE